MGMLEDWSRKAVATVLERVLGTFVEGINADHLRLDALGGDITLTSLRLRLSAFEALDLPVSVADGRLGSVRVKVPWRNLGKEPLLIELSELHLLLTPLQASAGGTEAMAKEAASTLATKREALAAWEATQERSGEEGQPASWVDAQVDKLVRSLLQKLEVEVSDVHVRVIEPHGGGPAEGPPAAAPAGSAGLGVVLERLRISDLSLPLGGGGHASAQLAQQMAEHLVRKAVSIEGLALYMTTAHTAAPAATAASSTRGERVVSALEDADSAAGYAVLRGTSLDLSSSAVSSPPDEDGAATTAAALLPVAGFGAVPTDAYLLAPTHAEVHLELDPRRDAPAPGAAGAPAWPKLRLRVYLEGEIALALRHAQLGRLLELIEAISRKERRHRFRGCGHPAVRPMHGDAAAARLWWQYARRCVTHLASEDVTAVTWWQLTRRRQQRLDYLRAYGAYRHAGGWRKFHETTEKAASASTAAAPTVQALEALESRMSLDLAVRYRGLARAVAERLRGRWWEESSAPAAGIFQLGGGGRAPPPPPRRSGSGKQSTKKKKKKAGGEGVRRAAFDPPTFG